MDNIVGLDMFLHAQSLKDDFVELFPAQVSAELQQEVLMSLIQTDPDVIDYLLRRKLRSAE